MRDARPRRPVPGRHRGHQQYRRRRHHRPVVRLHSEQEGLHHVRAAYATGSPIARPAAAITSTSRCTIQISRRAPRPSAMRMPISFVRRATLYAMVPYSPTQAISTARIAKQVHSVANVRSCPMV